MKLFPRWHPPESVARQLIDGLESGALALGPSPPDLVAEAVRINTEIDEILVRLQPSDSPPQPLTVEELEVVARRNPEKFLKALDVWREIHARAKALEAALARRRVISHWVWFLLLALPGAFFYVLWARPLSEFVGYAIAFCVGLAVGALPRLLSRARAAVEETARLRSAVAEFIPRAAVDLDPRG